MVNLLYKLNPVIDEQVNFVAATVYNKLKH